MIRLVLAATLLAGCLGGGPSVQRIYYSLQPTAEVPAVAKRHGARVVVRPFDVAIAYRRQELVYRTNPYQFSFYNYRLWAARPDKLLTSVVGDYLRRAGVFSEIGQEVGDALPDYELAGEILAIEELDSTEKVWFGRLALRLVLRTYEDRKVVWEHAFDRKERVVERDPVYVVKTINALLVDELGTAAGSLERRLAELGHKVVEVRAAETPNATTAPANKPRPEKRPKARRIR